MPQNREKIKNFLSEQVALALIRAKAYVYDFQGKKRPTRNVFATLKSYLDRYIQGDRGIRWITLTGLRGAGKTTLLYQLFNGISDEQGYRLFLSLDQTKDILEVSLNEVLEVYEDILGQSFERLEKPLFLFLDETQYDSKWGIVIKSIYDRTPNVCVFVTGSAALHINTNTDIARRSVFEKLFPLSFIEYQEIFHAKHEDTGLDGELRRAILESSGADAVYQILRQLQPRVDRYFLSIERQEINSYLRYGTLPSMVATNNEMIIYEQISKTLDRVIRGDIAQASSLSSDIIAKIPAILYAVADMDAFNMTALADKFDISRPKMSEIFQLLEQTEILHRIYPRGSHLNQTTRKPSKFLFSSPAVRSMYYTMIGSSISSADTRGRLFEDLVGMYLHRFCNKKPGYSLTYDSAKGGADFVLGVQGQKIVIEVGAGKKDYGQIVGTSKKVKPKYSLIISENELEYNQELNAVKIPLKIFLLA